MNDFIVVFIYYPWVSQINYERNTNKIEKKMQKEKEIKQM